MGANLLFLRFSHEKLNVHMKKKLISVCAWKEVVLPFNFLAAHFDEVCTELREVVWGSFKILHIRKIT